jgi:hypothetical protein
MTQGTLVLCRVLERLYPERLPGFHHEVTPFLPLVTIATLIEVDGDRFRIHLLSTPFVGSQPN